MGPGPGPAGAQDVLDDLGRRLAALADAPAGDHPAVLEAVHDALVAELDHLARATAAPPAAPPA